MIFYCGLFDAMLLFETNSEDLSLAFYEAINHNKTLEFIGWL